MRKLARGLILTMVVCVALAMTAALVVAASSRATPGTDFRLDQEAIAALDPELAKLLVTAAPETPFNIIIEMREQVNPNALLAGQRLDKSSARGRLVNTLRQTAERTQASIRAILSDRLRIGAVEAVKPFWIFNGLAVAGARPELVRELARRPDVARVRLDHWRQWIDDSFPLNASEGDGLAPTLQRPDVVWGVARIGANKVWRTLGISGTGVVVANLDTGVDWQHPDLQPAYRGYSPKGFHQHAGNWYDATDAGSLYPVDGNGHGSHTMGIMVGQNGIGVAPGAHWIAVRAFRTDGYAFDSWLHDGFQWLLAPDGNPDLAPDVVNNSWGNNLGGATTFQQDVKALRAAGIFAVFSAGNNGPDARTVGSPASLPGAFAVGASDQDDEIASFSSHGPSPWGEIRPHVVAPGVNLLSTMPGGVYAEQQGTSMAAPHVAGTAALLLSAQPHLDITQTFHVLTSTAVPLSDTVPNNAMGYGRVDALAAVADVVNAGDISGHISGDGLPLAGASIAATSLVDGLHTTAASDARGDFRLLLDNGYYDLTVSAFGYAVGLAHAVPVEKGATTIQNFDLDPLPTGRLIGVVTGHEGESVEARLHVLDTPVVAEAAGGGYQLDLPAGQYVLEARALGYRVITASVSVTPGNTVRKDFVLPGSPRILLVDSGAWYYDSQAAYYRQALDALSYAYDEYRVKHMPDDSPGLEALSPYDVVLWSAPADSPGLIGAGATITDYLAAGGNLLLSGQDVAFWDGGGYNVLQSYYLNFAHAVLRSDNAPSRQVMCSQNGVLSGLNFSIEGGQGADNQRWPDQIRVLHPDHASRSCSYEEGEGAVIQADVCNPHRSLVLGFGFEAISAEADRNQLLAQALDWFASERPATGLELLPQTLLVQAGPPGTVVTHVVRLRNTGEAGAGDAIRLELSGDTWPASMPNREVEINPCQIITVPIRVQIPDQDGQAWNAYDAVTLTARSTAAPNLAQTLVFTSKLPAPVLLVDDDRWYPQVQTYAQALEAAGAPYDRWKVTGIFGSGSPPEEVLSWYPMVLWFTGYDWYDPLHTSELERLTGYLNQGGRLFLSSQDALEYVGDSEFAREYLGVISYSEHLSQTVVHGVPGSSLGDGVGTVKLSYPFRNWSDSIAPAPGTQVLLRGAHGQAAATSRAGKGELGSPNPDWRTTFFSFPFEALPQATRDLFMSRLVGWLNWLGESRLEADHDVVQPDDTLAFTLTLHHDGSLPVRDVTISNSLPVDTALVDGPGGGAVYDPRDERITWSGDLLPGQTISFTYRLRLATTTPPVSVRNVADIFLGDQGLGFQREAVVRIMAPDLSASRLTVAPYLPRSSGGSPDLSPRAGAGTPVMVTLLLRNDGLVAAPDVSVDNPLPWPMRLITDTLEVGSGTGTELVDENRIRWEGELPAGRAVTLTYRALAPALLGEELWLYHAAHLEDGLGGAWERGGWVYVEPNRFYLPFVFN